MDETTDLIFPCVMSGERETLTVRPTGRSGVMFAYSDDASVIVEGENLIRIRDLLNERIAAWEAANNEH